MCTINTQKSSTFQNHSSITSHVLVSATFRAGYATITTPRGMHDRHPAFTILLNKLLHVIVSVFQNHGAQTIETPTAEMRDILLSKYGNSELESQIFNLEDMKSPLALRYDFTVPFARYLSQYKITKMRRYQVGHIFRKERSHERGRYREFYQCDFDIAGEFDLMTADAECLFIVDEILSKLPELGAYQIKVNHRKFLDGLFKSCGVSENLFRPIMSAVDKLDKCSWKEVKHEMVEEKGLSEEVADILGKYVCRAPAGPDIIDELLKDSRLIDSKEAVSALEEMRTLFGYLTKYGIEERVVFDLGLARGLDYYTGLIYEAVLTEGVTKEGGGKGGSGGETVGVGSVSGGGRYDELVGMFTGKKVPCVGVSLGVERILTVLEARAVQDKKPIRTSYTQVYVCNAHKGLLEERMALCAELWRAGLNATFSGKGNTKLLNQLQTCEEKGIPLAVILGQDELKKGNVILRLVVSREDESLNRSDLIERLKSELAK